LADSRTSAEKWAFFVLVVVPRVAAAHDQELEPARFFVASSFEVMKKAAALRERAVGKGKNWKTSGSGLNWGDALEFENRWDVLPA
jgi:hypothetical protein